MKAAITLFDLPMSLPMSPPIAPAVVLVVEDDALLRMLAVDLVRESGFETIDTCSADGAIEILKTRSDVSLLFTDVNMPGSMDGLKLAHWVRRRWPSIGILVASGLMKLKTSDLPPESRFLSKPYRAEDVTDALQSLVHHVTAKAGADGRTPPMDRTPAGP